MNLKHFTYEIQKPKGWRQKLRYALFTEVYYTISFENKIKLKNISISAAKLWCESFNIAYNKGYENALKRKTHSCCSKKQYVKNPACTNQL